MISNKTKGTFNSKKVKMFKKVLFALILAAMSGTFFCGCDQDAVKRIVNAAPNKDTNVKSNKTKAEEKEVRRVANVFFNAFLSGNGTTAEYYLAPDAKVDRKNFKEKCAVFASMGKFEHEILDVTVTGNDATVDIILRNYGQDDKNTGTCTLKKTNGNWKIVTFL